MVTLVFISFENHHYSWFATTAAKELNVQVLESFAEPEPHKVRKTLLKSAFVNSKHRVQYEFR